MAEPVPTVEERLADARDNLGQALDKVRNLEIALRSGRVIGTAVGIVMERLKLTPEDAFALLVAISGAQQRKVHDLAVELVETGSLDDQRLEAQDADQPRDVA